MHHANVVPADPWDGRLTLETRGVWVAPTIEQLLLAYAVSAGEYRLVGPGADAYERTTRRFWSECRALLLDVLQHASGAAGGGAAETAIWRDALLYVRARAGRDVSRVVAARVVADLAVLGLGAQETAPHLVPKHALGESGATAGGGPARDT